MRPSGSLQTLCLFAAVTAQSSALEHPQILLGPVFPPPQMLKTSQTFSSMVSHLSAQLKDNLATGSTPFGNFTPNASSASISILSTSQETPLFSFHFTSSALNSSAGGTTNVTGDSIFRIGSISKLFTVYAFLLNGGIAHWNRPVTDYVPELREDARTHGNAEVDHVAWEEVTLGSLASSMSGVGRDFNLGDLSTFPLPWTEIGLPELAEGDVANCSRSGADKPCNRTEYFKGLNRRHPVFLSQSTPVYSNTAFRILSYAIEVITGETYENIVMQSILEPLGLAHTTVFKPQDNSAGVIPQGDSSWEFNVGDEAPTIGIYSTSSDLATLGRHILLSSQLTPSHTRRWLKPLAHTSALTVSVGAPWEIWRTKTNITTGRTIDLYTKGGSIGLYESLLVLIPDYQVAASVAIAGPDSKVASVIAETILQKLIPVLEVAARDEAAAKMAGRYVSREPNNSSMLLSVDDGPGLVVESWINNGSDLLETVQAYASATNGGEIKSVRLYPTDLVEAHCSGSRVGYRAVFESDTGENTLPKVKDQSLGTWQRVDQVMYGNVGVDDFVFDLDSQGVAMTVESRVLKVTLIKHQL